MPAPELVLALVGLGHVGRRFVRLLAETAARVDLKWRLVGVATATRGHLIRPEGIDGQEVIAALERGERIASADPLPGLAVIDAVLNDCAPFARDGRLVVIEATRLDIDAGEPATTHVTRALEGSAHAITVNKGPVACRYRPLARLAESVDRLFLFEGAVMDGIPVFNLVRDTMPGVTVQGFRGIVNTTCQFALSEMERGVARDAAIGNMQAQGIAEADPSLDVHGWDAAAKTAALVNVLMGGAATPRTVAREGIDQVTPAKLAAAAAAGRRLRLVASAARHGDGIDARVSIEPLDPADPLATLGPLENALYLRTDLLGEIGIVQRTSSLTQTAYALLSDLMRVRRWLEAR